LPEVVNTVDPVDSIIEPDAPNDAALALLTSTEPDPDDALVPLINSTLPPVNVAASPPLSSMLPPAAPDDDVAAT
jgi:hypothetical protein